MNVWIDLDPASRDADAFRAATHGLGVGADVALRFADAPSAVDDAEVIVCGRLDDATLARARRLRWVSFWSAGLDRLVGPALLARGVPITKASGVHGPNIAEHVMALILSLTRHLPFYARAQERRAWEHDPALFDEAIDELAGKTVGVVGLGRIGEAVAKRARAFDARVIAVKRDPTWRYDSSIVVDGCWGMDDLERLLVESDHCVVCAPLTPETRGLLDARRLALLPRGARVYNIGRGAVIDEAALVDALARGHLGGAGLDVFEEEPLPKESPLWAMPNVIITPHVAGHTPRYFARVAALFAENLARFVRGAPLSNLYDPARGY